MKIRKAEAGDLQQIRLIFQKNEGTFSKEIQEYDLEHPTRISIVAEIEQADGHKEILAFGQAFQTEKREGVRSGKLVEKVFVATKEQEKIHAEFIKYWLLAAKEKGIADFFVDLE